MWRTILLLSLGVVGPTLGRDIPGVRATGEYERAEILDKRGYFVLFWNYNETHVTFETHVKTTGWVGFGLSGKGVMHPGDVVIGWVTDDGSAHLSDRHTVGHSPPVTDVSQDWKLLYGEENEFGTVLKFVRRIDTCDADGDTVIPSGTTHAIYAYGSTDPTGGSDVITYHNTSRGTKSLALLTSSHAPANMPSDLKYYDFLNQNHILSDDVSSYGCQYFQMPDLGGKHHMIKYEPLITPGNEENIHHIILYRCKGLTVDDVKGIEGNGGKCYSNTYCNDGVIGWGIGGGSFYFPEHIGFSIGAPEDATLYIMETHYHNSAHRTGAFDNSGLRMTLTSTLRPQEAGCLTVGSPVNPHLVIPPHQEAFLAKGYCCESCIRDAMADSNLSEIKIISAGHHAHALAVAMTTRHFRNGTELEPILTDPNYNTNFEEIHVLPIERSVYPGDSLRMDCTYDSSDRSEPTFGGLSSQGEMCIALLYYYPTMHLWICDSENRYDAFDLNSNFAKYQYLLSVDWSNKTQAAQFEQTMQQSSVTHFCLGVGFTFEDDYPQMFVEKDEQTPYTPPPADCP